MFAENFAEAEIGDATQVAGAQQSFKSDLVGARETAGHVVHLVFLWNAVSTKPSSKPYHKYGGWFKKAVLLLPLLPFSLSGLRALRSESKSCVVHGILKMESGTLLKLRFERHVQTCTGTWLRFERNVLEWLVF